MSWSAASSYSQQPTGNYSNNVHGSNSSDVQSHLSHHRATGMPSASHWYNISHNTPYLPPGMHSSAPDSPTSHINTSSQDLYCESSLSHVSYTISGLSNHLDNTTAPADEDSSHKRKSIGDPAESRPTIRQRQMTTPSTIVRPQPYITTSQGTREAPDIRVHAPSTHMGIISHVPGAGPSTIQPTTILSSHQSHLSFTYSNAKETRPNDSATDLWHFVFGCQQQDEPEDLHSVSHQTKFTSKPKTNLYPFIGCRICKEHGKWIMWKNSNGCNKHIRRHLVSKHEKQYMVGVREEGLKHADAIPSWTLGEKGKVADRSQIEPCTEAGLKHRLIQWVLNSGQPLHVVERPEFRELIRYATEGCLGHKDLPSRATLEENITQEASRLHDKLVNDLAHSLGGISITYDTWLDKHLGGFSAVTVHWCTESPTGDLVIRSELAALKYDQGPNADTTLGKQLLKVFETLGPAVAKKIMTISHGGRCYVPVQTRLELGEYNDVDCFHLELDTTIQFAIKRIKFLRDSSQPTVNSPISGSSFDDDDQANLIPIGDVIKRSRNIVWRCQSISRQDKGPLQKLAMALSQDYETNWGSFLFMIERLLEMRPILSTILLTSSPHVKYHSLSDHEWSNLRDARDLLDIIRQAQLSLDFGHCEAMSHAILTYINIRNKLGAFLRRTFLFRDSVEYLMDCCQYTLKTNYAQSALIINPITKFSHFIEMNGFDEGDNDRIKEQFIKLMIQKCRNAKQRTELRCRHESHDITDESESDEKALAEAELSRYLDAGLEVQTSRFSLLSFWKASRKTYPSIYAIALDYLPAQAAAVSCKRIFSTSEHTDALRDGRMSFQTFEMLQRLKFSDGKVRLHNTVWSNLNIEDAFTSYLPAHKYPLDTLLAALPYLEYDSGPDSDSDSE